MTSNVKRVELCGWDVCVLFRDGSCLCIPIALHNQLAGVERLELLTNFRLIKSRAEIRWPKIGYSIFINEVLSKLQPKLPGIIDKSEYRKVMVDDIEIDPRWVAENRSSGASIERYKTRNAINKDFVTQFISLSAPLVIKNKINNKKYSCIYNVSSLISAQENLEPDKEIIVNIITAPNKKLLSIIKLDIYKEILQSATPPGQITLLQKIKDNILKNSSDIFTADIKHITSYLNKISGIPVRTLQRELKKHENSN
jgi:hypothetical protein